MDLNLSGVCFKTCLVYLDDVLMFSRKLEGHIKHVGEVRTLLGNAGVSLKIQKCQVFRKNLNYLYHVRLPSPISIARYATSVIVDATFPENLTQLRSFLCAWNIYQPFTKDLSTTAEPLKRWLRKDVKRTWNEPPAEQRQGGFEACRLSLVEPPVLSLPVAHRPFLLYIDSTAYQLGVTPSSTRRFVRLRRDNGPDFLPDDDEIQSFDDAPVLAIRTQRARNVTNGTAGKTDHAQ